MFAVFLNNRKKTMRLVKQYHLYKIKVFLKDNRKIDSYSVHNGVDDSIHVIIMDNGIGGFQDGSDIRD